VKAFSIACAARKWPAPAEVDRINTLSSIVISFNRFFYSGAVDSNICNLGPNFSPAYSKDLTNKTAKNIIIKTRMIAVNQCRGRYRLIDEEKASSEKALEIAELQRLTDLLYAQPSEMSAS
jgi:hypothetical protein